MVASAEHPLKMLIVHDRFQGGFFVALVPADLPEAQVEAALHEIGVDAGTYLELADWRTAECGVAVAHVPFPARN
jgi:hypothetical protein